MADYITPPGFDADWYLKRNAELDPGFATAGIDTPEEALAHYIKYGRSEGRATNAGGQRAADIQAAVSRGELTEDEALDLLVEDQVASEKGDDFGSLAKPPYRAFTPYESAAPTYTPVGDFKLSDYFMDPGYQFRMDEGMKAIDRGQAARGNFYSGGALKEAQRFAQGLASDEFGKTYGRYVDKYNRGVNDFNIQTGEFSKRRGEYMEDFNTGYNQAARDSDTLYSRLAGLTNAGMGATNTAASANQNFANAQSGIYGQAANASAANTLATGNQITSAISNTFGGGSSYNRLPWQQPGLAKPSYMGGGVY